MRALEGDHGPDHFRKVQAVSGGFRRFYRVESVHAVSRERDEMQPFASTDQAVSAFDFSSAILDWQRLATRLRSVRARAVSHSRSSAEASYWSL